jgi:hypothetical protein
MICKAGRGAWARGMRGLRAGAGAKRLTLDGAGMGYWLPGLKGETLRQAQGRLWGTRHAAASGTEELAFLKATADLSTSVAGGDLRSR